MNESHPPVCEPCVGPHLIREIASHRAVDPGDTLNARLSVWADERDPNSGGASHHYQIVHPDRADPAVIVHFQHGPRNVEGSQPGATDQSVLAILIDRYGGYQAGPYACPENEEVLTHLTAALVSMGKRSKARREQGVIGQNLPHDPGDPLAELLQRAEVLEKALGDAAQQSADPTPGRGPIALALNVAKTQVGLAVGSILRAQRTGAAVGSG